MYNEGEREIKRIIEQIMAKNHEGFTWQTEAPNFYDEIVEQEPQETQFEEESPTIVTLRNIKNLCDTIETNIFNSETASEQFLGIELIEIENKLKELNDNLNALQNYNNNQIITDYVVDTEEDKEAKELKLLTGDIILNQ